MISLFRGKGHIDLHGSLKKNYVKRFTGDVLLLTYKSMLRPISIFDLERYWELVQVREMTCVLV